MIIASQSRHQRTRTDDAERHRKHRELIARKAHDASTAARDIGPTPLIANVRRRNKCRNSLRRFCEVYGSQACYWAWSADHLLVLTTIEESVYRGATTAVAMPRGSGKTTICRLAVLWAVSYAHIDYAYLIGANEQKAIDNLNAIKVWMRELHPYVDDFPEIAFPIDRLGNIAHRAAGQHQGGEPTLIRWEKTRIVLPRVTKPKNMRWQKGPYAPTACSVIDVSGLTGESIRGALFPHPDGRQIRPGLVLLDDPQTDESARSRQQNVDRLGLIQGAVLGMAGPGAKVSAVMPCTVIRRDDMVDQVLDRKKNPLWRGVRTKLMRSMPSDMAAWESYWEVYAECMGQTVPDIGPANEYYRKHRDELDAGADAAWPERKEADEVSATQHAMNLLFKRGEEAFWSEYQNEPIDETEKWPFRLNADEIAAKCNGLGQGVVPKAANWVTAYVDVHERLLYYVAAAWEPEFGGAVIDYGTYPRQPTSYFAQTTAPVSMADRHPGLTEDAWILRGLGAVTAELLSRQYKREDGAELRIGRLLIDARWGQKTELVKQFCRRHPQGGSIVVPAMGIGIGPTRKTFLEYRPEPGAVIGLHWRLATQAGGDRVLSIDTNWWKTFAAERLSMPMGTPGGWELFGRDAKAHALFADHQVAEVPKTIVHKETGRERTIWELRMERPDNHYWDCLCGAAAAASMLGASIPGVDIRQNRRPAPGSRPSLKELARR